MGTNSRRGTSTQESFFFVGAAGSRVNPPFDAREVFRLSAEGIHLGTSSWKYRGWEGMIYAGGYGSEAQFQHASLREYTHYFPAVGADFTYFAYPTPDMISFLVNSSPENFRFCPKVTKRITMERFPDLPVYGKWAGRENPEFLSQETFCERFLQPVLGLGSRLGPVIFEFPRVESADRLEGFFLSLPKGVATWALEAKEDLGLYARMMEWGVAPVLQISSRRAPLSRQWMAYLEAGGGSQTMPLVVQADLHPSLTTEEATRSFQPYSCLVREDEEGREALREITKFARQNKRKAFILFHNRWEGSAPWSVGRFLAGL